MRTGISLLLPLLLLLMAYLIIQLVNFFIYI